MNAVYWALLTIDVQQTPHGCIIVCTTDIPCHLFMRWTYVKPKQHKIPVLRRGLYMHTDKYFCFDVYTDNEQQETGDTLIHTFIKEPWAVCETRWFYFHATIGGASSVSTSAIFKKHRTEWAILLISEPWTRLYLPKPDFELYFLEPWGGYPSYTLIFTEPWTLLPVGPPDYEHYFTEEWTS